MTNEKRSPAALAGAHRAQKLMETEHRVTTTLSEAEAIAAIIAHRHRLSPRMARLVCQLANIGGRQA